jgi:hypothetical protein
MALALSLQPRFKSEKRVGQEIEYNIHKYIFILKIGVSRMSQIFF